MPLHIKVHLKFQFEGRITPATQYRHSSNLKIIIPATGNPVAGTVIPATQNIIPATHHSGNPATHHSSNPASHHSSNPATRNSSNLTASFQQPKYNVSFKAAYHIGWIRPNGASKPTVIMMCLLGSKSNPTVLMMCLLG